MKLKNKQKIISGLKAEIAKCVFFALMLALPSLVIIILGAVSADEPKELAVIIALSMLCALGAAIFAYAAFNTGEVIRKLQSAHAPEASFKTVRCTKIRPIKKISAHSSARIPQYSLGIVLLCDDGQKYKYFLITPLRCRNSIFFQAS